MLTQIKLCYTLLSLSKIPWTIERLKKIRLVVLYGQTDILRIYTPHKYWLVTSNDPAPTRWCHCSSLVSVYHVRTSK
jgi:hypothetical protein